MRTDYVVGFALSGPFVLLVLKARPAWQKGKLNGVGGHVEAGELPLEAMRREFFEETGIWTQLPDWRQFAVVHTTQSRVFMFATTLLGQVPPNGKSDEPVVWVPADQLKLLDVLPNLHWLVPMAMRADDLPVPAIVHETANYETAA